MSQPSRRPGDRVIRRRLRPTRTITLPTPELPGRPPTALFHARVFVFGFFLIIMAGTMFLMLPWVTRSGNTTSFDDALFIATSAASVTGLVTLDTLTHWNFLGQLVILILIQAGGLGFMVGTSLILRILGRGESNLRDQMLIKNNIPTLSLDEAMNLTRKIFIFTVVVELIGAMLLTLYFAREMSLMSALWHGVFHSISAFCNAGFDLQGNFDSLTGYRSSITINLIFITLIQLGAISYIALSDLYEKRNWRRLSVNSKMIFSYNAALIVIGAVAFLAAEWNGVMSDTSNWSKPMQSLFMSVSGRTAGFSSADLSTASSFTLFVFMALMFIGGASGSTAGGIKIGTIGTVTALIVNTIRGRRDIQIFNRRLQITLAHQAVTVVALFIAAHFLVTLGLAGSERVYGTDPPFLRLFFEAMSAIVTNGLGNGITPELHGLSKIFLCFAMFLGRIGPLTIVFALQRHQSRERYRLPEGRVHIG